MKFMKQTHKISILRNIATTTHSSNTLNPSTKHIFTSSPRSKIATTTIIHPFGTLVMAVFMVQAIFYSFIFAAVCGNAAVYLPSSSPQPIAQTTSFSPAALRTFAASAISIHYGPFNQHQWIQQILPIIINISCIIDQEIQYVVMDEMVWFMHIMSLKVM